MAELGKIRQISPKKLKPYENNARIHTDEQVEQIARSIREFGFISPVLIDEDFNVIAGHGRLLAAEKIGMKSVPCVDVNGLTDAQRRAYILADNRLTECGQWDNVLVSQELAQLEFEGFEIDLTGFDASTYSSNDWFENRERFDDYTEDGNEEYNEFLGKFEHKKTTDDCYTPDNIYNAVADWVSDKAGVDRKRFIRPFYPGGDYRSEKYPAGCFVCDNPPFSILAEIVDFYEERKIPFFLFSPGLTCMGYARRPDVCVVMIECQITYENGATVNTGFLTNAFFKEYTAVSAPDLDNLIRAANDANLDSMRRHPQKYEYPPECITGPALKYLCKYGQEFKIPRSECAFIRELDSQKQEEKQLFGAGVLISERLTKEYLERKETAKQESMKEKSCDGKIQYCVWQLSEREREIIQKLGESK